MSMAHNIARKAYSAEQLLALRHSASDETAIQIEAKARDGAIKDHVVRNTRSFAARSTRSLATSDTLHPPPNEPSQFSAPALTEIDPNNQNLRPGLITNRYRPSPTPSLKKRKAEQILKDHGSPPGLRVTAGGRIVPSDQSPLCSPRYGYSAIKKNGMLIKFGPNFPAPPGGIPMQRMGLPNGFVAQDPDGRLCQMVDGKFLPVDDVDGIPQLYIAAPNLTGSTGFPANEKETAAGTTPFDSSIRQQQQPSQSFDNAHKTGTGIKRTTMKQPAISVAAQIQALEKQYSKLEQESKDLDKVEVLQRSSMSSKAYAQLVQNRRDLVGRMNSIRVSIKSLREAKSSTDHSPQAVTQTMPSQFSMPPYGPTAMMGPAGPIPDWAFDGIAPEAHNVLPFHGAPMPHGLGYYGPPPPGYHSAMAPYPGMFGAMPPMFNMMGMSPVDAFGNFIPNVANMDSQAFSSGSPPTPQANTLHETGSSNGRAVEKLSQQDSPRRTHALQIKNPENKSESSQKSALNPMSPSYQPAGKSTPASKTVPTRAVSPSPALAEAVRQHNAWVTESANASATNLISTGSQRKLRYESSSSSYATADFFPNNPRDHSMRKEAYPVAHDRSASRTKLAERPSASSEQPVTPDKENQDPVWNFAPVASVTTPPSMRDHAVDQPDTSEMNSMDPIQNRSEMNVSPKNRRSDYPLSYKSVSEVTILGSGLPSPAIGAPHRMQSQQTKPTPSPNESLGLEEITYMNGFKAGTARLPVGLEKNGLWLDGYCAGLLKSAQPTAAPTPPKAPAQIDADPVIVKPYLPSGPKDVRSQRAVPAINVNASSMKTLKDVVFSAQNENAVLTPDPNGPCVDDMAALHLGTWAKAHQGPAAVESDAVLASVRNGETVLPDRASSAMQRQISSTDASTEHSRTVMPCTQTAGAMMERERVHMTQDRRATSAQMQSTNGSPTAYFQRVYPAHRVMSSQLEWKSGSSIAQVAGLATGYFAQYDGTRTGATTIGDRQPLTQMSGNTGMTTHDTTSGALPEKKQPGMSAKLTEEPMTVDVKTGSPSSSPIKRSPTKGSPAKVKFAQIAGRAGIKVRSDSRDEQESEPSSPQEKRRWRDVWTKRFTEPGMREGEQKQGGRP